MLTYTYMVTFKAQLITLGHALVLDFKNMALMLISC